jgi:quinol-cytochrome oxidoreductase complex cytochrome b subunit
MNLVRNLVRRHIFWSAVIVVVVVSYIVSSVTGRMGIARVAGQLVTLALVVKLIYWIFTRGKNKKGETGRSIGDEVKK